MKPVRVQILGAGGIGCVLGMAFRRQSVNVTFVEINDRKIESGRKSGVQIVGQAPVSADFVSPADWIPHESQPIFVCTKCYHNRDWIDRIRDYPNVIPVQNGFDSSLNALKYPNEGIASFVSECESDRPVTRITRPGALHLGPRHGSQAGTRPEWLTSIVATLRAARVMPVVEVDDILPIKHTKLLYNAAISPLAAAAGMDNGQLLSLPLARTLFFALIQENYCILTGAGCHLGKVGPFHPDTVMQILRRRWLARLFAKAFEPSLRGTYCSMAGEIQKGRTELENYTGYLLSLAKKHSLPAPANQAVFAVVQEMVENRRSPRLDVLETIERQWQA